MALVALHLLWPWVDFWKFEIIFLKSFVLYFPRAGRHGRGRNLGRGGRGPSGQREAGQVGQGGVAGGLDTRTVESLEDQDIVNVDESVKFDTLSYILYYL